MAAQRGGAGAPLEPALAGDRATIGDAPYRANIYAAGAGEPLLLVHSINAAPSAFEVKPIYDDARAWRRVYALELPGFGLSERSPALYNIALYVDAVLAAVAHIKRETGAPSVDVLGLSLSCEFVARAALQRPGDFRRLIFVTPTGFQTGSDKLRKPAVTDRGLTAVERFMRTPLWSTPLFRLLSSKLSITFFLRRTFGSRDVDPGLIDYAYRSAHQPSAAFAPWAFLSGKLFGKDIRTVYEALSHPVWLVHGTKGAFNVFGDAAWVERRANWQTTVFDTGAFPHFQDRARFSALLRHVIRDDAKDPAEAGAAAR